MKIKYFYDPLCGWCYGASPILSSAESLGINIESHPIGLFAGKNGKQMSADWSEYAWSNDQRIQKMTGQIFSKNYKDRILSNLEIRFDSFLPTVAILSHESKFKGEALSFLRAMQKERFVEGSDITNPEILAKIAKNLKWDSDEFLKILLDQNFQQESNKKMQENNSSFRNYPANGVPFVVIEDNGKEKILNSSYLYNKNISPVDWFKL
ncbi:MAG: DsbA family protein [Bdellovibrionales bacterium]|nr:DsbA family protein [Bdellovibrionales bacterium]